MSEIYGGPLSKDCSTLTLGFSPEVAGLVADLIGRGWPRESTEFTPPENISLLASIKLL